MIRHDAWRALALCVGLFAAASATAGQLSRADITRRISPPLVVGEKPADTPAWPIHSELTPDAGPVGWVFESIDLAPIPGFEGSPYNLLIQIDTTGQLLDVQLLRQHEPVFLSGLGEAPLRDFLAQYAGLNLSQSITVSTAYSDRSNTRQSQSDRVVLDGVTKATASVRIANQTVLTAALAVARTQLGFAGPAQQTPPAEVREDRFEVRSFAQLLADGSIARLRLTHADVDALFAGTDGAGLDASDARPDALVTELYVAYLNAPTIGRAILGDAGYAHLREFLEPGQHAWWVATTGPDSFIGARFVRGTSPERLSLQQHGTPFELRDFDTAPTPPPGAPALNAALVLRTSPLSGLDPAAAQTFELSFTRQRGQILPQRIHRSAPLAYTPPADYFRLPPAPPPEWLIAWRERAVDLSIIGVALLILSIALARPRWLSRSARRLRIFRLGFLAFTLIYIGWMAQGQLSIVQITGAIKTLAAGHALTSFLYDPVSLLIMAFTLLSFFIWGRGSFCGWLCPFGALQEFAALLGARLGLRARRLPPRLALALDRSRYGILLALVLSAALAPAMAERLVEVEPFKTAITVGFDRAWPFVLYALGLLALGAVYYKFFCRYLCPLGAAMVIGGKLRLLDWLPRRAECGQPCQTCRHRCAYDAIDRNGSIRYNDCFQCLDCVGIYHDEARCAPLLLYRRKGRRVGTIKSS
ncbi:4Fe-4S binding protein [Denitromonas halophila]|uniref:4Fe-4S binding protein n=1 Tax=Denitromonas halophila TaxID=1629404 RepID=UPI0016426ADE|nr:4Fe-4S binding protein [Denitromonas halophila]